MKKTFIYLITAFAIMSLFICGAWTTPVYAKADTEARYADVQLISTYSDEVIYYDSKTLTVDISTPNGVPLYYQTAGMENGCGPVGGTIVVGYYDKYFSNMIPDWDSAYANGKYRTMVPQYTDPVMWDLYDRMKTNVVAPGVSETEFKDGLKSYVNSKGRNISYESVKSNSYSTYKAALQNKKPIVLFVQPSNLYFVSEYDGYDSINTMDISGNHIMVVYGYQKIQYKIGNSIRTDEYLILATGFSFLRQAYYKINLQIDAAYAVNVY